MAAPTLVDVGTGATDAQGAWTYTCQASAAAGNLFIVHIMQDGVFSDAVTVTSATNIEKLDGTDNDWDKFAPGFDKSIGIAPTLGLNYLWFGRALSTSAPTIGGGNSTSEDLYILSYQFENVNTGTTFASIIENIGGTFDQWANGRGTDATVLDTAVVTAGSDRLACNFVGIMDDSVGFTAFSGATGGQWWTAGNFESSSGTDATIELDLAYPGSPSAVTGSNGTTALFGGSGTSEQEAQSFLSPGATTITSVAIALTKEGTPTDNVIVEIQTDAAGIPSGTVVGSSPSRAGSTISTTEAWYPFAVNATVSASTTYWIVIRRDGARDTVNDYRVGAVISGSTYTDGAAYFRSSGSWTAHSAGIDHKFTVSTPAGATVDGGSASIVSNGWGVIGFALIGTTTTAVTSTKSGLAAIGP